MKRSSGSNSTAEKDREAEIQQILAILHKWGIHTLGQLAALNKEELAARLGPEAVRMWERANGKSERLLKLVRPPESFDESFEFENEIETAEPLLFILRRFLEQLSLRLSGIYFAAKELTLRITFANKQQYERCFKIPQPTNDVDLLFRMLQTHLENFKSEHPIIAVSLQAHPIKPNSQQFGLFETTLRNPNQLSETLARLTALLGADRVGTPVLEETHLPDAFHLEPFCWQQPGGRTSVSSHYSSDATQSAGSGQAPRVPLIALRRFRPAVSASVFLSEKIPADVRSANVRGKVAEQRGPYLASGNWWDETAWARAEWDLQLENGSLIRCHESEGTWKINGIYD
jgi:protein ImuB